MSPPKTYSIIIVPSDHSGTRQFRVTRTLLIAGTVVLALTLVVMTVFAATYTTVLSEARRAQTLEIENDELRAQVERVDELSRELESLSALRAQVLNMLGTEEDDLSTPTLPRTPDEAIAESVLGDAERLQQLFAEQSRQAFAPRNWPVEGRVRKEFFPQPEGAEPAHPGIALELHPGETIRAAGRGRVLEVDRTDPDALTVVIDHGFGFRTLYRGLDRIDVDPGQSVDRKQVIGRMDGEPGADTNGGSRNRAGTLYFELRVDGAPVDPRSYLTPR